jgi:hypothetical protein
VARALALGVAVFILGSTPLRAETRTLARFTSLEVLDVDNQRNEKGERIPPESLPKLKSDLERGIAALHLFQRVGEIKDAAVAERVPESVLHLRVKIISYTGSRNAARVTVMLTLIDSEKQQPVREKKIEARPGVFELDQGAFSAIMRKVVRSVTDVIREDW